MKNLNLEKILSDAEQFSLTENDSYIKTYPEFLKYFEEIKPGEINDVITSYSIHYTKLYDYRFDYER